MNLTGMSIEEIGRAIDDEGATPTCDLQLAALDAIVAKRLQADAWFANAYYVPALDVHVHASVVRRNQSRLVRRIDFGRNGRHA